LCVLFSSVMFGFICIVIFYHCPYYSLLLCCLYLPLLFIITFCCLSSPLLFIVALLFLVAFVDGCRLCCSLSSYCSASLLILIIIMLFVITILLDQVLALLLHVILLLFIIALLHVLLPPLFVVMVLPFCLQCVCKLYSWNFVKAITKTTFAF
jgi:hypothetical protein